jgi:hypothetical protein
MLSVLLDTFDTQIVTTLYKSLSHRVVFSVTVFTALLYRGFQMRKFLFLGVPDLSPASASATLNWLSVCRLSLDWLMQMLPGLSYQLLQFSTDCLSADSLDSSLDSLFGMTAMSAGPRYIALARTAQETPLPTALLMFSSCLLRSSLGFCRFIA